MSTPSAPAAIDSALEPALARIEGDEDALVEDLTALIEVDTSFPPGAGYGAFADRIASMLDGFETQRVAVPQRLWDPGDGSAVGERVNMIARQTAGISAIGDPCSIYFHVDTVPPGAGWTRPPLTVTREGDRLYGRGTADMKGSIAAVMCALRALGAGRLALRHDPVLLFCTDEEGGLYPGIRYLAEQGLIEGHILSFNGGAAPRIWAGCFGSLDLAVDIEGRAAHSGEGLDGINAIEATLPLLQALQALGLEVGRRRSRLPPPPHYPEGRPLRPRLTIAGIRGGGDKGSAVPGDCRVLVNRRYAPEEAFEDVLAELQRTIGEALAGSGALGWRSRILGHLAPVSDPTGPHWPRWQAALSAGFGYAPGEFRAWGAASSSDMGWVQQVGIREILLGGLTRPTNNIHGADEYTTLADLKALAKGVLCYLAEAFRPDGNEQGFTEKKEMTT